MASPKINLGTTPSSDSCYPASISKPYYPALYVSRDSDDKDLQGLPSKGKAVVEYRVRSRTVSEDSDGKKRTSADIEIQSIEPLGKKLAELSARIDGHVVEFGDKLPPAWSRGGYRHTPTGYEPLTEAHVRAAILGGYQGSLKDLRLVRSRADKEPGVGAHIKRNKKKYAAAAVVGGLGAAATTGYLRQVKKLFSRIDTHLREFAEPVSEDPRPRDPMGQFTAGQTNGLDPMTMKQAYKKKRAPSLARIGRMAGGAL